MLLTKYKVQELVEDAKIDLDKLEKYAGVKEINDDSIVLVYTAIAMLKNHIIEDLGRL
nr:MAG TPA: hypothetical protein [Caudoviricetes sp.]